VGDLARPEGLIHVASFDIGKLDDVIHGRVRLGVMAYLADAGVADFTELKNLLDVTQGNLSVHLRKLEEANYISIDKSFLDRKPLTRVRMTDTGRGAFKAYLEAIGKLVGGEGA
jgi:DNA-binding MarR family transcriptional regulator